MIGRGSFTRFAVVMMGGLLVWAVHFLFVYVFTALACARGFHEAELFGAGIVPFAIGVATAVAIAAIATFAVPILRSRSDGADQTAVFLRYTALLIALLSVLAIAWEGLPALIVRPCA